MDDLRPGINAIRTNWSDYGRFMCQLGAVIKTPLVESTIDGHTRLMVDRVLDSVKSWEPVNGEAPYDYSAVRLYTAPGGYDLTFAVFNEAMRQVRHHSPAALIPFVFLLELLNIDLYRMQGVFSEADRFDGIVYRGLYMGHSDIDSLHEVMAADVRNRYVAVPLGLWSTSRDISVATDFATNQAPEGTQPVIWRICIRNLDDELLSVYRERFPKSIVTSLCAVPIESISAVPGEREVILRGAFLQILSVTHETVPHLDKPAVMVNAVMWNSNRDHVTALADNLGEDAVARTWFRTAVSLDRTAWCARHDPDEEARASYKVWADQLRDRWAELTGMKNS